jgi:aspartate aminotransferase
MTKLQGQSTTCVPPFALAGMRAALTRCGAELEAMRTAFARRAELIYSLMSVMPGVRVARPIGAFYVFPDISAHLGKTTPAGRRLHGAADFAAALLDERRMAVVPGEDFGSMGVRHIRMSFACSEEQIREGCTRLSDFIASLK